MKRENINFIIMLLIIVLPAIMLYFTLHPMSNELGEGAKELIGNIGSEESVNNETEAAIMDSINRLHGKKTLIIIAHRLQTIEKCDMVYRIEDGKAVRDR